MTVESSDSADDCDTCSAGLLVVDVFGGEDVRLGLVVKWFGLKSSTSPTSVSTLDVSIMSLSSLICLEMS